MFICETCHQGYPYVHFFTSSGSCEICRKVKDCYDCKCHHAEKKLSMGAAVTPDLCSICGENLETCGHLNRDTKLSSTGPDFQTIPRASVGRELTHEEKITNRATLEHIGHVRDLIQDVRDRLDIRSTTHDKSKLYDPELPYFAKYTHLASGVSYGSPEYQAFLDAMKPAIDHHYRCNLHHPEHYPDGIEGMSLIDLIEMLCDWMASTKRYKDGDIRKSLDIHVPRFKIGGQLETILRNTIVELEGPYRVNRAKE